MTLTSPSPSIHIQPLPWALLPALRSFRSSTAQWTHPPPPKWLVVDRPLVSSIIKNVTTFQSWLLVCKRGKLGTTMLVWIVKLWWQYRSACLSAHHIGPDWNQMDWHNISSSVTTRFTLVFYAKCLNNYQMDCHVLTTSINSGFGLPLDTVNSSIQNCSLRLVHWPKACVPQCRGLPFREAARKKKLTNNKKKKQVNTARQTLASHGDLRCPLPPRALFKHAFPVFPDQAER